jgi:hypothetical protein
VPAVKRWCLRIAVVSCLALLFGCGGSAETTVGFKRAGPPPPQACVKKFNESPTAIAAGSHAYSPGHDSRAGHVFKMTDRSVPLLNSCVVVFAAKDSDREYGILGEVDFLTAGWDGMANLSLTPAERAALQRKGAEQANIELREDGTIVPLN